MVANLLDAGVGYAEDISGIAEGELTPDQGGDSCLGSALQVRRSLSRQLTRRLALTDGRSYPRREMDYVHDGDELGRPLRHLG